MGKTCNTYISISIYVSHTSNYRTGRIYTSNEAAKLDLHLDVPYEQAKKELAKLMLRTGKMPDVIGAGDPESTMYILTAFLD